MCSAMAGSTTVSERPWVISNGTSRARSTSSSISRAPRAARPGRRLGHAVAAQVVGDQPELVPERALVLLVPAQVVLRPAVDEQDRRPVGLAPLAYVQPQAAAALDVVGLHPPARLRYRRHF